MHSTIPPTWRHSFGSPKREVHSRSLISDQDHVQLRAGQVRQQLNKIQVKEIVDHMAFHKFLDLDTHDIRYVSSLTEEKVEEHYKHQEERCKAITEPEHICRLLHHLLHPITLIRSFGALGKTLSLLWCRLHHFHQSARQNRPTSWRCFCRIQRLAQHGRQHRRNWQIVSGGPRNYRYKTLRGKTCCKVRRFSLINEWIGPIKLLSDEAKRPRRGAETAKEYAPNSGGQ